MRRINLIGLSVVSIIALAGCGGSSSSSTATIGTGYYVDNAVKGIKYICGTQTSTTDKDGKFTFEKGKECTFSLAGIPLRTTSADELIDGQQVLEDNPKVAKLLQSIDSDGNLTNGIQITDKVIASLIKALETAQSTGTLPEGTVLTEVVASVGNDIDRITGDVRTDTEVTEHLTTTQTKITKSILSGKTFYKIMKFTDGTLKFFKMTVNDLATSEHLECLENCTNEQAMEIDFDIQGNTLLFNNGATKIKVEKRTEEYILLQSSSLEAYLYTDKIKAKTFFDSLKNTTFTLSELVGKTLYQHVKDNNGKIGVSEITLQSDGKIKIVDFGNTEFLGYRIVGDVLYVTSTQKQEKFYKLVEKTDKYIKFNNSKSETSIFYFRKTDAESASVQELGE